MQQCRCGDDDENDYEDGRDVRVCVRACVLDLLILRCAWSESVRILICKSFQPLRIHPLTRSKRESSRRELTH